MPLLKFLIRITNWLLVFQMAKGYMADFANLIVGGNQAFQSSIGKTKSTVF